jgi:hypothetical protein
MADLGDIARETPYTHQEGTFGFLPAWDPIPNGSRDLSRAVQDPPLSEPPPVGYATTS